MVNTLKQTLVPCAANGRSEPKVSNAALSTNGRYQERAQKPSTDAWVLNGVFGIVKRGCLGLFQKGGFLENDISLYYGLTGYFIIVGLYIRLGVT